MTTRKDLIIEKYLELQKNLKEKYEIDGIFPSLEDVDISDLIYFFNLKFNSDDVDVRMAKVQEIAGYCNVEIKEENFNEAFILINEYIDFLKNILKSQ